MGGLLKRNSWERERIKELQEQLENAVQVVAALEKEVACLRGEVRASQNQSMAAGNRCERLETRLNKLEAQITMPDTFERRLPPGDEDDEHPTKMAICSTCRGSGIVAWLSGEPAQAVLCSSCNGTGQIEVVS